MLVVLEEKVTDLWCEMQCFIEEGFESVGGGSICKTRASKQMCSQAQKLSFRAEKKQKKPRSERPLKEIAQQSEFSFFEIRCLYLLYYLYLYSADQ